jgi:hypothetical protein
MNSSFRHVLETVVLVAVSALLYVEFFSLNDLLFSELEHIQGVNWVFLPAGFRVLLVLGMGLPGAAGIMLANYWIDQDSFIGETAWLTLITGVISGFTPWCVKWVMEKKQWLARQLHHLTAQSLLHFVLAYAVANALGHQFVWWAFNKPGANPWVDFWPMFVGDAIGSLLILYTLKLMLPTLSGWAGRLKKTPAKTGPEGR